MQRYDRCWARPRCSGSYNKPGYLRLDFAWQSGLSQQIRGDVEEAANQAIRKDLNVSASIMPLAKAREIGALALFGETYDEQVRVVEMGGPWSRELCGGTHVRTPPRSDWSPPGESSVGSGVRRVEAFVGIEAFRRQTVAGAGTQRRAQGAARAAPDRINKLVAQLKEAEKRIADLRSQTVLSDVGSIVAKSYDMWGLATLPTTDGLSGNDLRSSPSRSATVSKTPPQWWPWSAERRQAERCHRDDPGRGTAVWTLASWCVLPARPSEVAVGARPTSPKAAVLTAVARKMPSRPWSTPSGTRCSPKWPRGLPSAQLSGGQAKTRWLSWRIGGFVRLRFHAS